MNNSLYGFPPGPLAGPQPPATTLISQVVVSAAAASIIFDNIPQHYTNLRVAIMGRGDNASTAVTLLGRCNGIITASYNYQLHESTAASNSGSESLATTFFIAGRISGGTATADYASGGFIYIPNYASTVFNKVIMAYSAADRNTSTGACTVMSSAGFFHSRHPITRLDIYAQFGNYVAGTVASLYGEI